jgi:raffinose/stachyose/melibiose transport system permease protein
MKIKKKHIISLLKQIVAVLCCIAVLLPFYLVVINSFKTQNEAARLSLSFPKEWMFENYTEVIEKGKLWQGFYNSFIYSAVSTAFGVLLSAMAAFVLCRKRTKLNNFLY